MKPYNCDNRPVGIFDSGLGGLTVVRAVQKALPHENIIYLGDTARVPYGNRSPETVRAFALDDVEFLRKWNVKAIVAACNTVSALALDTIRERIGECPLTGVILPGAHAAISAKGKRIAVLGTRGTIDSKAYEIEILRENPSYFMQGIACPLFVPLAEEGITNGSIVQGVLELYLKPLKQTPPDIVLLGCTHYPLFREAIADYLPSTVTIIDSAHSTAAYLAQMLKENQMEASPEQAGFAQYYVTDLTPGFDRIARRFLNASNTDSVTIRLASPFP